MVATTTNLISWLEPMRPIFLTAYYQGSNALVSEVSWAYTTGLVGIMLGALFLIVWLFLRRDIGVQSPIRLPPLQRASAKRSTPERT